ncbi:MAG TPA: polymer-forming cytoskeletal protein [Sediminispirochaeta sp.]|nr:polymer-forming cytoskeletal protein [Sediminispirochaeta sp.]
MARGYVRRRERDYTTVLDNSTRLFGKLTFTDSLKINGYFEGEIEASGVLFVEEGAHVVADIKAKEVIIAGRVEGNISAKEKVEMMETCSLIGDVRTQKVRIADGVSFDGKCEMIKDPDTVDIFSAPVETLKKTVSSV